MMKLDLHLQLKHAYAEPPSFLLDINLHLPAQGVSMLWGPSGSGKTTVLRALAGLTRAHGRVAVGNDVWQDDATGQWLPTHHRPIGVVFQDNSLWPHLNVQDNLLYGYRRVPVSQRRIKFDEAVQLLGIEQLLPRHTTALSGGERQRVAIARALLASPALLLMDEPLSAIDASRKAEVFPYLEALSQSGVPIVYVTHAMEEAARLADHLVLLHQGRVQVQGPAAELLSQLSTPFSSLDDAGSVLFANMHSHEALQGLSQLKLAGSSNSTPLLLWVGACTLPLGASVRVRVLARDVSVSVSQAVDTSILNIWPAQIESMQSQNPASTMLRLRLGENVHLLARITHRSVDALGLRIGQQVFAQVKGVALLG